MRFVIYGAGAVGGVVAGRLHVASHKTVVIARGEHLEAIRRNGLTLAEQDGRRRFDIPAVAHPRDLSFAPGDVAVLTVKSQDTLEAVKALREVAPMQLPVVCLQNGVENERTALRWFSDVYGVMVMLPATFLEPGVVAAHSSPTPGLLDLGRWPTRADGLAEELASALRSAGFDSRLLDDLARWKYRKLLDNLSNIVGALCGPEAREGQLTDMARIEGDRCLRAAGIDYASEEEDRDRRGDRLRVGDAAGQPRQGNSSWQSLARATGTLETDFLNGEIVLLGRLHGVPTPVNALLQDLAREQARRGLPGESRNPDELLDQLK
jgi:2-dehydropantoate 2-reductase